MSPSGIFMVEPFRRPAKRDDGRKLPTEWNWRELDPREQVIVAEGLAQDLAHGLAIIAGRTP